MRNKKYDFAGWATKNDLRCADGRTIKKDAFLEQDGLTVPLVWSHDHRGYETVLGHALLKNRPEGVRAYGYFNDTEAGANAKKLVEHGDITHLSIYANNLKQLGGDVIHGMIREVSLVLAGANPGAVIDEVLAHNLYGEDGEAIITTVFEPIVHSDIDDDSNDILDEEEIEETEEDNKDEDDETIEHSDKEDSKMADSKETKPSEGNGKTVQDVIDSMNEEQQKVLYGLVGAALEEGNNNSEEGEDTDMKHNLFDNEYEENTLSHAELMSIVEDAKSLGSLKQSFIQHGIEDIDMLFPEYKNVNGPEPQFIKRNPDAWVDTVMNGVHHSPVARIKMMFADITGEEARAKGYTKGKYKLEEVFGLLKRTISPTTVYKKQKLDRDDVTDITDFDVIAFLKAEMRMMLNEELARAIVFSDGRSALSPDKVKEQNIIPIIKDEDLFTIKATVTPETGETEAHAIIRTSVEAQDNYEGSGNITGYFAQSYVTKMLLMEDADGHRMYKTLSDLADAVGVNKIVKVPNVIVPDDHYGVLVDLSDYTVGADKGGAVSMFDDFDIDFNQMKYLLETRCSGGLTRPYSAIALKKAN